MKQTNENTAQDELERVLAYLNGAQKRATYGAVAEHLGVKPRAMGGLLGEHSPYKSFVVNAQTSLPTDYEEENLHPELERWSLVITSAQALERGMAALARVSE